MNYGLDATVVGNEAELSKFGHEDLTRDRVVRIISASHDKKSIKWPSRSRQSASIDCFGPRNAWQARGPFVLPPYRGSWLEPINNVSLSSI